MNIEESLKKLFALHNFGVKLGLDNTIRFLKQLNNPQAKLRTFHIAGSNGKGSTASFIASILQELGFKVGLYTSPHFIKFNERILINGTQISDEYISNFMNENDGYIFENELTFFEVTTAMAFKYFAESELDFCVIETGLGGRLDATNVLDPLAVTITSISLEHTNVLGNTIEVIAKEKAEIIKPGSKVFISNLEKEAIDVVERKCEETSTKLYMLQEYLNENEEFLSLGFDSIKKTDMINPLKGVYQYYNASLAALTVSKTLRLNKITAILNGIKNVIKNTGIQGRYEYLSEEPTIILDSAHNHEGISNFLSEFKKESAKYSKRTLLFGAMKDKSIRKMIIELDPYFDEIVITGINYERAAKVEEIKAICVECGIQSTTTDSAVDLVRQFLNRNRNECLVVLGSMFLIGEIKSEMVLNVT